MLRLGGVASRTYLVAFPAIKQHFQQHGLELDWVLYSSWDALVEAFVRREVDLAWNGPLAYLKLNYHQLEAGGFKSFRRTLPPTERESG